MTTSTRRAARIDRSIPNATARATLRSVLAARDAGALFTLDETASYCALAPQTIRNHLNVTPRLVPDARARGPLYAKRTIDAWLAARVSRGTR